MVLIALGVVLSLVAVEVVGSSVAELLDDDPTALEQTIRCLRFEKGLRVTTPRDPIARSAEQGAVSTVVEGNPVTISISNDDDGPEHLAALYERVAGHLGTRLEQRGKILYLFEFAPSPTQQQALYDCAYS